MRVGASFNSALREADELGLTEPDPRENLGGRDVARKLVILGRMAGFSIEMADVDVKPLLPDEPWVSGSLEDFWDRLPEVDEGFVERRQAHLPSLRGGWPSHSADGRLAFHAPMRRAVCQ